MRAGPARSGRSLHVGPRELQAPKSDTDAVASAMPCSILPRIRSYGSRRKGSDTRRLTCDRVEAVEITRGSPSKPPVDRLQVTEISCTGLFMVRPDDPAVDGRMALSGLRGAEGEGVGSSRLRRRRPWGERLLEAFGYGILTVDGPMLSSAAIPTRGLIPLYSPILSRREWPA